MSIIGNYQDGFEKTFDPDEAPVPKTQEELDAEDVSYFEGVSAGFQKDEMSEGIDVDEDARSFIFTKYGDYDTNKQSYDSYANMREWYNLDAAEDVMRMQIDRNVANGRFSLVDGEVVDSDTSWLNDNFMYDMEAVKGALLAKANGYNNDKFKAGYKEYTALENKKLDVTIKNAPFSAPTVGAIGNYLYSKEAVGEILGSPAKVTGKNIAIQVAKRVGAESVLALMGGLTREERKRKHAAKADLDYGLADSAENILLEMAFASAGGVLFDGLTSNTVKKFLGMKIDTTDAVDKEILNDFVNREESKLTSSSIKHEDLIRKAEADLDDGRPVDVSDELDIPIESKLAEDTVPNSMPSEVNADRVAKGVDRDVAEMQKVIEDTPEVPADTTDLKYGSMADDAAGDELIVNVGKVDPEIEAELKALEAEEAALQKRINPKNEEAARLEDTIPSEDELAVAKKDLYFGKSTEPDARYKNMSKSDIAEQDRMFEADLIAEADTVFAKGGDNVVAGTVAGIEEDENGNLTFNPEKFVLGLGGYTAAKAAIKSSTLRQELKDYAMRRLDEFENTRTGQAVTGKQEIINGSGKPGLLERKAQKNIAAGLPPKTTMIPYDEKGKTYAYDKESDTVFFEAGGKWREMPNEQVRADVKYIDENGVKAFRDKNAKADVEFDKAMKEAEAREAKANETYKDSHTAPVNEEGAASIDNLADVYPDDIYSPNAVRYYGDGNEAMDNKAINILNRIKGKPNSQVTIYRSVPKGLDVYINKGDWVSITKDYVKKHGDSRFDGEYTIISKKVKAKDIYTDGNSIHEQGYDPQGAN